MGIAIQEQTTLLFFDEIQANERALTSLNWLVVCFGNSQWF